MLSFTTMIDQSESRTQVCHVRIGFKLPIPCKNAMQELGFSYCFAVISTFCIFMADRTECQTYMTVSRSFYNNGSWFFLFAFISQLLELPPHSGGT